MWIRIGAFDTERNNRRSQKGRSLIEYIDDYTVIDVETTGRDPNVDRIIQVSCLTIRNGKISDQFDTYVNPEIEISPFISNFTGITNDIATAAPTIDIVIPSVFDFIGNDILVGHNIHFDINFLYDAALYTVRSALTNDFIDTLRIARRLFPEWPDHRLSSLVTNFGLPAERFHNSLDDVIHTYHCYEYMKQLTRDKQLDKYQTSIVPKQKKHISAKDIKPSCCDFNPDDPYCGKMFVFTGTLYRMERKDAMQLVVDHGGQCSDSVNKKTNYLVLGDYSQCMFVKDGKTTKLKRAEELILGGQDLQIISEDVFFGMSEDYEVLKAGSK